MGFNTLGHWLGYFAGQEFTEIILVVYACPAGMEVFKTDDVLVLARLHEVTPRSVNYTRY